MPLTRRQFTKHALLATAGCTGLIQSAIAQATGTIHVVQKGDFLGQIARSYGTSISEIKRANHLSGDTIRIGQKLKIPNAGPSTTGAGTIHIVQKGDTLGGIAIRYGVSVSTIKRTNSLNSDMIRVGQKLNVPTMAGTEDFLADVRAQTAKISVRQDNWRRIIAHHSAIKYGNAAIYGAAHRKRGMQNGLAYHFVIGNGIDSGDGEIEVGPRWTKQLLGGHVKSYRVNLTAIGICLVGNFEANHPTRRQLAAFTQLVDWLRADIIPKATKFAGHKEIKGEQTICPGKHFPLAAMHARYS